MAYCTLAEVRALEGLDDTALYTDAEITAGISWAEDLIDTHCGTSFTYKAFTATLTGNGATTIRLVKDDGSTVLFPRTLTSVTVDGNVEVTTGWALYPEGIIARTEGSFTYTKPGRNIVVVGTAGVTSTASEPIAWAARTLARYYALSLHNRVDDRALQIQNDFGTVTFAQAGGNPDRPTALPEVNAVLNRNRHRAPVAF
jgi:hypothetical protein